MRPVLFSALLLNLVCAGAPAAGFEFVVIGDTRPRFESESFKPFEHLIGRINETKPALVVNLGDLIYGYGLPSKEKQWDKYEAVIKAIQVPYYQTPGNHDTHSKAARRIYGRRFGKFYGAFDHEDCHFVLLDNTEEQRWGYLGPAQLNWLKEDLQTNHARAVFVFLHFPVWEPERITPAYYEFWAQKLHPLFRASRVQAVFGGHYHTYGPTREFDGIRYYITGGGGAELRPEYRKAGGQYHFMKVKVSGESFDVRVLTERGELTDPEADLMGGLQFASRHVSRIGIKPKDQDLRNGVTFDVAVENPYGQTLTGQAEWHMDVSAFTVEPETATLNIPAGGTHQYSFKLRALRGPTTLPSLPQVEFNIVSGRRRHRFHREVRFLQEAQTPFRATAPLVRGKPGDWGGIPALRLSEGQQPRAELRTCYDAQMFYLALDIPAFDVDEAKELGFSDEVQIGFAPSLSETDFGGDLLRIGVNSGSSQPQDRTPARRLRAAIPGARSACSTANGRRFYTMAVPLRVLNDLKLRAGSRLILDLSFLRPELEEEATSQPEPGINTFAYRVRYGSDSLVPVYFVELHVEGRRRP